MVKGICKLCLFEKELQRSHLIPKSVYKKTRSGDPKKPHPMSLTVKGSRQSSYQVMDYVLCSDCEQLLSENGEDYVMRLIHHNNRFPFLELLNSYGPGLVAEEFRFYSAKMSPGVDREEVAYFSASMFWRAAVHRWRQEDGSTVWIDFTDKEKELLRRHLLENGPFPKCAFLMAYVCNDVSSQRMFWMPGQNDRTAERTFILSIRGFTCFFALGDSAHPRFARNCMMNSPGRWITVRNCSHPRKIWELGPPQDQSADKRSSRE